MKHFKSILWALIVLMTISSCTVENIVEPSPITVSETKEFNVRIANTEFRAFIDSTFENTTSATSCEEIAIWESGGKYWGKYFKDGKWHVIDRVITAYKM